MILFYFKVVLGMILDDGPVFLMTIDKMEQEERADILQRWKTLVMTLDNYYHSQLKKILELHEKLFQQSKIALSDAENCLKKSDKDGLSVTDTIKLWNSLQVCIKSDFEYIFHTIQTHRLLRRDCAELLKS